MTEIDEKVKAELEEWVNATQERMQTETPGVPGFVFVELNQQYIALEFWGVDQNGNESADTWGGSHALKKDTDEDLAAMAIHIWQHSGRVVGAVWADGVRRERELAPPEDLNDLEGAQATFYIDKMILAGALLEDCTTAALGFLIAQGVAGRG